MRDSVLFWVYLVGCVLSIPCYGLVFVQAIRKRILIGQIHNHVIFLILLVSFLQVAMEHPILLTFLFHHGAPIQTNGFCQLWACLEYAFNGVILMLLSYASVQRYLLVFHRTFIHRHLILLHYGPMIFFVVYPCALYLILIFAYPCVNQFDFLTLVCAGPCYLFEQWPSMTDIIVNLALPLIICTTFNVLTVVQVLRQKFRMRQQRMWKKNRRLIVQLLTIVLLHDLAWFPAIICLLIIILSPVPLPSLVDLTLNTFPYGYYMVVILYPFVSLAVMPELRPALPQNLRRRARRVAVVNTSNRT